MFFCKFLKKIEIRSFPLFYEQCEQITQVAHQKWTMWANCSGHSPKMIDVSKSLRSLTKNKQFTQVAHQK